MAHNASSATVTTLTAEVKALFVGSRQVTLSVFRQLDIVHLRARRPQYATEDDINDGSGLFERKISVGDFLGMKEVDLFPMEIMGRVSVGDGNLCWVIGRHKETGQLVRAIYNSINENYDEIHDENPYKNITETRHLEKEYNQFPLIILAGLR